MKTFHFSKNRAIDLQDTAKTVEELNERFERSCTLCPKAGRCDENKCYVAQTHYLKKEMFEFKQLVAEGKVQPPTTEIVHTRKYQKSERFDKGLMQRLLTIALKKTDIRKQRLAIDQASVFIEMDDYKNAYVVLKRNGMETEAAAIEQYLNRR